MSPAKRHHLITIAGAVFGLLLFAWAVERVGTAALIEGISRVGWGMIVILGFGGARFVLRAQCWRWCLPPHVPLSLWQSFTAFLAGDSLGNITPLGLLASEPAKVLLTTRHLATLDSIASLALENLLYIVSVMAMLAFGLTMMLATIAVPDAVRWMTIGALIIIACVVFGGFLLLRRQTATRGEVSRWGARFDSVRAQLGQMAREHPGRLARVFGMELVFHGLSVTEGLITLRWLMGDRGPTLAQAIMFETINRLTLVVFKFIPFRIGIDEASSGAVASVLAITPAVGVALAIVRKVRVLFWSAMGLLLMTIQRAVVVSD
jgi:Lysylphosphatidylglycerol synthase TM region